MTPLGAGEREREFICHKTQKKTYKIIVNITIVAGYQIVAGY